MTVSVSPPVPPTFEHDVQSGRRFRFGKNWASFLRTLDEDRIREAERSLRAMVEKTDLNGLSFLDIGSGSGLFSLVARRLGARVFSFDYDPDSVACTETLRARYFLNNDAWRVQRGSALDAAFLGSLGKFDIVYSWGVLHHTGAMWTALGNALLPLKEGGTLCIALYNDQGLLSRFWLGVKKIYCSGTVGQIAMLALFTPYFFLRAVLKCLLRRENVFATYRKQRGMSIVHDWIDWIGGLPFEVATVEAVARFFESKGLTLVRTKKTRSLGNNEFVFLNRALPTPIPIH